jgi:hypothetical protein
MMVIKLSAVRAGRPFNPQEDSWYSFPLEAESTPGQLKNPMTSLGFEPVTFQLVAQCLSQLRYHGPQMVAQHSSKMLLSTYKSTLPPNPQDLNQNNH